MIRLAGYSAAITDIPRFLTLLVQGAWDYLFETIKTIIPETPQPIFNGDCTTYYPKEE